MEATRGRIREVGGVGMDGGVVSCKGLKRLEWRFFFVHAFVKLEHPSSDLAALGHLLPQGEKVAERSSVG